MTGHITVAGTRLHSCARKGKVLELRWPLRLVPRTRCHLSKRSSSDVWLCPWPCTMASGDPSFRSSRGFMASRGILCPRRRGSHLLQVTKGTWPWNPDPVVPDWRGRRAECGSSVELVSQHCHGSAEGSTHVVLGSRGTLGRLGGFGSTPSPQSSNAGRASQTPSGAQSRTRTERRASWVTS